jgi:hypothetical protein
MRTFRRWSATVLLAFILVIPILNIEKLAQEKQWDNWLVRAVNHMPDMTELFHNTWFICFMGGLGGIVTYLWMDYFSSKTRFIIKKRPQWEAELPLSEIFKPGNEIHALFLTGEGIFTRNPDYVRRIRRLILPSHDAQYLALAEVSRKKDGHTIDLGAQIRNYGRVATQKGVEVRYLSDHIGISFLICNPDKPEAWIHIGFSTPFIDADDQPILRINKENSPELYGIFLKSYNKLWEIGYEGKNENAIQEVPIKPATQVDGGIINQENASEFIPMKEAARKLYEAARAGKIPLGEASERLSGWSDDGPAKGSAEDILHWWAEYISHELPIYGRRPPSSILEEIPRRDVKHFIFCEEATKLKDPINDSIYYTNLAVRLDAIDAQYNFDAGFHGESL